VDEKDPLFLEGYLRAWDISPALVPVNAQTLWKWVRKGRFPAPIKLGPGTTAWRRADVYAWLKEKQSQSQVKP
jgi:prophage regulatory protein